MDWYIILFIVVIVGYAIISIMGYLEKKKGNDSVKDAIDVLFNNKKY